MKWRVAEKYYQTAHALFLENRYEQALAQLERAEEIFRNIDARGNPFGRYLTNGVSGLANTLTLAGICLQKLGIHKDAIRKFETSLVNSKFEKKKPFAIFLKDLEHHMLISYEKELEEAEPGVNGLLTCEPPIDPSYRFPYSLPEHLVLFARLYELAPDRHMRFKDFYIKASRRDNDARLNDKKSDQMTLKRMSISIWGTLAVIVSIYLILLINAFIRIH